MIYILLLAYVVGAVLSFGLAFGSSQGRYPGIADYTRGIDTAGSVFVSVTWPVGIPIFLLVFGYHGFKYR
jgi:hypothetical protein